MCDIIEMALEYCIKNGLYSMRILQDILLEEIVENIISDSRGGRNTQYISSSICVGVILISTGFIAFLIIVVVRDKNLVLAIFAEISKEDIARVLDRAKALSIRKTRFSFDQYRNIKGPSEVYWGAIIDENRSRREVQNPLVKSTMSIRGIGSDVGERGELELAPMAQSEDARRAARRKLFDRTE